MDTPAKTEEQWRAELGEDWSNFDCIYMLSHMMQAINEMELWSEIKKEPDPGGFTFSDREHVTRVGEHPLVQEDGHSGSSFGLCMRIMQEIAIKGWDQFVQDERAATASSQGP